MEETRYKDISYIIYIKSSLGDYWNVFQTLEASNSPEYWDNFVRSIVKDQNQAFEYKVVRTIKTVIVQREEIPLIEPCEDLLKRIITI